MYRCYFFLMLLASCFLHQAIAAVTLQSSSHQISLLELYTSEGCSSCPPADRWLSELKTDPRLWREVVPVAFHVDYWDYIGWPDRFAKRAYGDRQRHYAMNNRVRTVYTPGLILNGAEWREWYSQPTLKLSRGPQIGVLQLAVDRHRAAVDFAPVIDTPDQLELHVAVLGFGLSSEVMAGENRGRRLQHDFVVLGYDKIVLTRRDNHFSATINLPETHYSAPRIALAAWVSPLQEPQPLQAVGGWLP